MQVIAQGMAGRVQCLLSRTWLSLGRRYSTRAATTATHDDRTLQLATASALSRQTYGEVLRGWMVFKLLTYDWIVKRSLTVCAVISLKNPI